METNPQFDRNRPGCLYDRGGADSFYRRPRTPHWWKFSPNGNAEVVKDLTAEEIKEYNQGYKDNEENGFFYDNDRE